MVRAIASSLGLLILVVAAGCGGPSGKPFEAVQPIPAGKGILYVYQIDSHQQSMFSRIPSEILVNDVAVGALVGKDYFAFQCPKGPLTVSSGIGPNLQGVTVNVEPGKPHYVLINVTVSFSQGYEIKPSVATERDALEQLKDCVCVTTNHGLAKITSTVSPAFDLNRPRSMYVDVGEEGWQAAPFVVDQLQARGNKVTFGPASKMPSDTECYVKITEHWFWDLSTYLLELQLEFQDPRTKMTTASGKVYRAAPFGRHGPKVMTAEVINAIYNNAGMPAGIEVVPR